MEEDVNKMTRKTNMNNKDSLLTKWALRFFPLIFNKKQKNETFIYRKFLSLKFVRFIYLGNTIYKLFYNDGLYSYRVDDYSHVYKES